MVRRRKHSGGVSVIAVRVRWCGLTICGRVTAGRAGVESGLLLLIRSVLFGSCRVRVFIDMRLGRTSWRPEPSGRSGPGYEGGDVRARSSPEAGVAPRISGSRESSSAPTTNRSRRRGPGRRCHAHVRCNPGTRPVELEVGGGERRNDSVRRVSVTRTGAEVPARLGCAPRVRQSPEALGHAAHERSL